MVNQNNQWMEKCKMFLVIDGVSRGLGRGQRVKKRPQLNQRIGISEQQKIDNGDSTTTTTDASTSHFEDVDDEHFAMKKALGIHLILKKILSCLNLTKLLQARLVSRYDWFDVATEILIRRRCLRIDFFYSGKINCFTSISSSIDDTLNPEGFSELYDTLHRLTNCIRQSRKFPCVRFGLAGELNTREVTEFFHVYGSQVKELDLDLIFPSCNPQLNPPHELANILLSQAPNLDGLYIKSVKNVPQNENPSLFDSSLSSRPVKLPKLKRIILTREVNRDLNIIQDIITAAVSNRGFKCHFNFPSQFFIEDVDLYIQLNILDTVKELQVYHPVTENSDSENSDNDDEAEDPAPEIPEVENPIMELYRRFANTHHKLYNIYIDHTILGGGDFEDILRSIFYYNYDTLQQVENAYLLYDYLDIPVPSFNTNYEDPYRRRFYCRNRENDFETEGEKLIRGMEKYEPLLTKILSHLDTSELLICRLVNRKWNYEASSILIERKSIDLRFVFSLEADRFILSRNKKEENVELPVDFFVEDLPTLCNLAQLPFKYSYRKRYLSFPFFKISIITPISIMAKELDHLPLNFTETHGLSELELIFDFGPHTTATEWKFIFALLKRTRHLNSITLTNINNYQSPRNCVVLPLSQFKSCLEKDDPYIRILNADKLDCRGIDPDKFTIDFYQSLLEESLAHSTSVSHLEFHPTGKTIELCEKIAESCPPLRSIDINLSAIYKEGESDNWTKLSSSLSRILKSSSQTLTEIKGIDQLGFLPGLKLPQFPLINGLEKGLELRNLKYEKVYQVFGIPDFSVSLLPRCCKFSYCFPFLTNLTINYFPDGANIDQHHPILDSAPSVKRLTIGQNSSPITPFIFQKISRMFPELEFLYVTVNVEDFFKVSRKIWTNFPKLKELVILFIIRADLEKQWYFPGIDAGFTGYTEGLCFNVFKTRGSTRNLWKKYPSLAHLRELKSLRILFEDFSSPKGRWNYLTSVCKQEIFIESPLRFFRVDVKTSYNSKIKIIRESLKWLPSVNVGINWSK